MQPNFVKARARAPLRIGLAGGGTDVSPYCDIYGGGVLSAAISLFAYATVEPEEEGSVRLCSVDRAEEVVLPAAAALPLDGPLQLHRGVYNRIVREFNGGVPLSLSITTSCDVPAGSGLGSSSTVVVAILEAFKEAMKLPLGEYDVARIAFEVERIELGIKGGRQDQYSATFGGINFMEFFDGDRVVVNPLRVHEAVVAELEASLVLYFTGASRESSLIIEEQSALIRDRREVSIEALHALKADAVRMKERLLFGDIPGVAEILDRSWWKKKKVSNRISNPLIDRVHARAMSAGAMAGKVSGAGGGGFMMFLVDPSQRHRVVHTLRQESGSGEVMACHLTNGGAISWRI